MGQRIRQLEDAVTIFQSGVSSEIHPLMRDELLGIKFGPEIAHIAQAEDTTPKELSLDAIDALGTLTIGSSGESKYFGRSAGSEVLYTIDYDLAGTLYADRKKKPLDLIPRKLFFYWNERKLKHNTIRLAPSYWLTTKGRVTPCLSRLITHIFQNNSFHPEMKRCRKLQCLRYSPTFQNVFVLGLFVRHILSMRVGCFDRYFATKLSMMSLRQSTS